MRDALLGRAVTERDWVVVGATPQRMLELGYRQVGRDFPVFLHPDTGEEYALARRERTTGPGHGDFAFSFSPDTSLEEDLVRRDFRVNAMARSAEGALIDPLGGLRDLRGGVLHHLSSAFDEDPLRILRGARFEAQLAGRGFALHPATLARMRAMCLDGALRHLSPERVWTETERALRSATPHRYFAVLRRCLAAGGDAEKGAGKEAWEEAMLRLRRAAGAGLDAPWRWAALHLEAGAEQVADGLGRKAPNTYQRAATMARGLGGQVAAFRSLDGEGRLEVLGKADAFRRPEDLLGLAGLMQVLGGPRGLREHWRQALARTQGLRPGDASLQGQAYGEELRRIRVSALERDAEGGWRDE